MHLGLLRFHTVNDSLVQIRGSHTPSLASEGDVVRVVNLAEVIERARLLRVRQSVGPPVVRDRDVTLLDVDVGGPVLAHGPELHEVAILSELLDREEHVEGPDHVVVLREDGPRAVDHGVRSRALLAEVDHGVGLEGLEGVGEELEVADVAHEELDGVPGEGFPPPDSVVD